MNTDIKPNLFIIGSMKSGTTSLHTYLNMHSQIFMSEPKEIHYFSYNSVFSRGDDWYMNLFKQANNVKRIGESSTTYTKLPTIDNVPNRIYKYNPKVKFIYIMRDPIQRTISHYWHRVRFNNERRNILEAIQKDKYYRNISHYSMQLTPYYEIFGPQCIYTLTFEKMIADLSKTLLNLFSWLGVESLSLSSSHKRSLNAAPQYLYQVRGFGLLQKFRHSFFWNKIGPYLPDISRKLGRNLAVKKVERTSEYKKQVIQFLQPIQIEQTKTLSKLLKREFPEWSTLYSAKSSQNNIIC